MRFIRRLTVGRRYLGRLRLVTQIASGALLSTCEDLLVATTREAREANEAGVASEAGDANVFTPDRVADLPDPARRYLLHAVAPGTPLAPVVRLEMGGTMTPRPGRPQVALTAEEVLAPRRGFIWTARARMFGLPVRVRDTYFDNEGGVHVALLGVIPLARESGGDATRSARGRLVAEAVWCPTALVGPGVTWEAVDADHARFTLTVDGESIPVTIRVGPGGSLREVTLDRWGNVGVPSARLIPYGFVVDDEATFGGVTIPVRLRGGWWFGTSRFDPDAAAEFVIRSASFCESS
jgi:hypothetical protein